MSLSEGMLNEVITQNAMDFNINPSWIKAIIHQESQWNTYALRYEPEYRYLYEPEKFDNHLNSLKTEMTAQRMSFGLGQIMGALAREQGHKGFIAELFIPEVNIFHIAIRLCALKKISPIPNDIFACYNGGPGALHKSNKLYKNQKYVDSINTHLQLYQL